MMLKIPEVNEVIVGELAERGEWVVANVETSSPWPVQAQKVAYRGEIVWVLPIMKGFYPAIAVKMHAGTSREKYSLLLMRFLSALAWVEAKGFLVDGIGGGSLPSPMGRDKTYSFSICEEFELSYLPEPSDDKALLALALMREGRGLNHPGYAFLSFYRVLEVAFPDGRKRGEWISNHVNAIKDHFANEALAKLRAQGIADVGVHLRDSGRRAIAHAREEPIIDPDDPSDGRRLLSELPIMSGLAQMAIEEIFGIETRHRVWENHLYKLAGFKKILGPDIVDRLRRGEQIADEPEITFPPINVQLRRRAPYPPLSNLVLTKIGHRGSHPFLLFESERRAAALVRIRLKLNFAEERLVFDHFNDLEHDDRGTPEAAEAIAEMRRFSMEYFANGRLEIYNAQTGELISRKDAYLPMNIRFDFDGARADIAAWKQLAITRREWRHLSNEMTRRSMPYDVHVNAEFNMRSNASLQ